MRFRINRAMVGYPLAGIAMLFIFLYLRFPGEALTDYAKADIAARYPGATLSIDTIRPSFPPGFALSDVTVGLRDRPDPIVRADGLTIRPGGLALLRGRVAVIAKAAGYGGEVRGRVEFSRFFSGPGPAHRGGGHPESPHRQIDLAPGDVRPPRSRVRSRGPSTSAGRRGR